VGLRGVGEVGRGFYDLRLGLWNTGRSRIGGDEGCWSRPLADENLSGEGVTIGDGREAEASRAGDSATGTDD